MRHAAAERPSISRWTASAVRLAALLGCAVSGQALLAGTRDDRLLIGVALLALLTLPWTAAAAARKGTGSSRARVALSLAVGCAQLGLLAFLSWRDPVSFLPATLVATQGHLMERADDDLPSAFSVTLAAAQAVVAFLVRPSGLTLLALPAVICTATAAGALLHGRQSSRSAARVLRHRDLRAPSRSQTAARVRAAVVFGAVLLACTFVMQVALRAGGAAVDALATAFDDDNAPQSEPEAAADRPARASGDRRGMPTRDDALSFAESIGYEQPLAGQGDQLVARVRPLGPGVPQSGLGPLYVRAVVFDVLGPKGLARRASVPSRRVTDGTDGALDGWTRARPSTPPAGREYEIEQTAIELGRAPESVIATVDPVDAIDRSPVVWYDDDVLTTATSVRGWFTTRVSTRAGLANTAALAGIAAAHPDPAYTQLPNATPSLERVTRLATQLTSGAADDRARVLAIAEHFRMEFGYSTRAPSAAGMDALADFLDDERGYCLQFASTSALMYRSLGIPARVVQGFLADEWIAVSGVYDVYPTDVHAWVEVHFQGVGWVRIDPTPAVASTGTGPGAAGGLADWFDDALGIGQSVLGGGPISLDDVATFLARGPGAVRRTLGRGVLVILALVVVALGVYLLMPSRRSRATRSSTAVSPAVRAALDHYHRVVAQLARLGHVRRPNVTPREFAVALVGTGDHVLAPFGDLTDRFYAVRFGDEPFTDDDAARFDRFVLALREVERIQR